MILCPRKNLARLVPAVQRELREAHNRAERRMAQDAVVARERLLGAVTQSIGAGIVVIDAHGRCRLTNREGERLLGLASLEVFGRRVDEFLGQMKNLGSDNSLEQQIMEVLSGTRPGWHEDIVWQRADNTHIPLSWVVTPLEQNGRVTGAVITFRDISERQRREEALRASREQLRALSLHLETLQEAERSRIARELHDELGQMLLAIKLDAAWVHGHCQEAPEETNRKTRALLTLIDETIDAVRRIAADLRPAVLNDLGLVAAIEWLVERFQQRSGVVCTLQVSADDFTVPPEVATAAFRMVQESLTNVARHAQARHLHVAVAQDGAALCVVVDDDGVGFAAEGGTARASFGLIGIRERAAALGGTLKTGASEHGGARLVLRVPLARGVA